MKVHLPGKPEFSLTKSDFVAQGGEGSIYVKNGLAFKVYENPKKMIPVSKMQELRQINIPEVINPLEILHNHKSNPVGYSMKYVKDTYTLCQLFTKSFKTRSNVTSPMIVDLIQSMRQTIRGIHSNKILIVDLNEFNLLVDSNFQKVYFIDVDSYQTTNYPAPVIMQSIRDPLAKIFTSDSDWFSFAVITFQLFVGIHPYKGKHPSGMHWEERMKQGISVFDKNVKIPKVCSPFSVIPKGYLKWYQDLFMEGKRCEPPENMDMSSPVVFAVTKVLGDNHLQITLIKEFKDDLAIKKVYFTDTGKVTVTENRIYTSSYTARTNNGVLCMTPKNAQLIEVIRSRDNLEVLDVVSKKVIHKTPMNIQGIMGYDNRTYIKNGPNILELNFLEVPNKVITTTKTVARVLENSSVMYEGVVIQDMFGTYYASVFPEPGTHKQVVLKELKGHKIVNAKFDSRVLCVLSSIRGRYYKSFFGFKHDFTEYTHRVVDDISIPDINFVCLENGICANINDQENLELFHFNSSGIKEIQSGSVSSETRLYKHGIEVYITKDNALYKLKTK